WGNGGQWLNSAQRAGYSTGSTPVPGAIMVSSESFWGHVAYVESVDGDEFTIVEMNARGWGVTSRRTKNKNDRVIKGFIY
ncbi:MAG: CHAP domain-containing protein, partial [bacterium]|nr:CHAP domain-containing protein [bacterium]